MFEGVGYEVVGAFLDGIIKVVGAIALIASALLIVCYQYRIRPCIPLNRSTYRFFLVLGRVETVLVMVTTTVYLIACWAELQAGFSIAGPTRLLLSFAVGWLVVLAVGRKGLGIPLGYGVICTIDGAHRLDLALTDRVLSFHVNKRFLKYREEALVRIAEAILLINGRYGSHDAIFLSWIFANKADVRENHEDFYKKARFNLLAANVLFRMAIGGSILLLLYLVYVAYTKNFGGLHLVIWMAPFAVCVCGLAAIGCLVLVRKRVKVLLGASNDISISDRVKKVADGLKLPEGRFSRLDVGHGPMPFVHLATLTPSRKVMKSAVGIESGFVIVGKKEEFH